MTFSENINVTGSAARSRSTPAAPPTYSSGTRQRHADVRLHTGAGDNAPTSTTTPRLARALNGGTIKDAATNNATLTLPTVGGASSIGGQKAIVVDPANPTASVTTPAVSGNSYNAASLPGNLAGSSADTGGSSTVSTVQIAIQNGSGNYWGGATFNQVAIFYNATGGTTAAWTYSTATLVGQLTNGNTYTITARSTDPAGNTGTATRTFVYDSGAPTVTNVDLDQGQRRVSGWDADPGHGHLQRERRRHRHDRRSRSTPAARPPTARAPAAPHSRSTTRPAPATTRPTSTT